MRDSNDASRASVASFRARSRSSSDSSYLTRQYSYIVSVNPKLKLINTANWRWDKYPLQKLRDRISPRFHSAASATRVPNATANAPEPIRTAQTIVKPRHSAHGHTCVQTSVASVPMHSEYIKEMSRPRHRLPGAYPPPIQALTAKAAMVIPTTAASQVLMIREIGTDLILERFRTSRMAAHA